MKEEFKVAFESALATHDTRIKKAKDEEDRKASERSQFKADWKQTARSVVVPALQQIADEILIPKNWICRVTQPDDSIIFEGYLGDMRGMSQHSRPTLTFKPDEHANHIWAHSITRSQSGSVGNYKLLEINEDLVHSLALTFIQRLAGESGSYGTTY